MTRRFGLWFIGAALGLTPLSGCALWDRFDPPLQPPKIRPPRSAVFPHEIIQPVQPPAPKLDIEIPQDERPEGKPPGPKPVETTSVPPLSTQTIEVLSVSPPVPHEPLVDALQCVFDNRPQEALQFLAKYDPPTQEFFLGSLSYLSLLAKKGVDKLSPSEVDVLNKTLQSLAVSLRHRTKLTIDKAYFCARITDFGIYDKLPEGHAFLPGELVQLYVELRNFFSEPVNEPNKGQYFVTRLASSFEIRDQNNVKVWADKFDNDKQPIRSQSFQQDYFNNFCMYLPSDLRPGTYHLTILVKDETRPEQAREAGKTLEFRVTSLPGRIQ